MYHLISNLFGPDGRLELDGDEESVNRSSVGYPTLQGACDAAEVIGDKYPNASVDVCAVESFMAYPGGDPENGPAELHWRDTKLPVSDAVWKRASNAGQAPLPPFKQGRN